MSISDLSYSSASPELTILLPCLNERETLGMCIAKAQRFLMLNAVVGEIIIADNGSTDGSQAIALKKGVRLVHVSTQGYGAALSAGIEAAHSRYVIMGDSDDSYDFLNLMPFLEKLRGGYDLVMGNRFTGGIASGAMPALHRYFGNPVLSFIGRLFFASPCGDFHCGLRGFNRQAILALDLRTTGMEFASEMVVKATLHHLNITEIPTTLSKDGRSRSPHLKSWQDGWRHLRFLLMYSPRWLFFYPGLFLFFAGITGLAVLTPSPIHIGEVTFDVHTLVYCGTSLISGSQILIFAFLAKLYCVTYGLHPADAKIHKLSRFLTLEKLLIFGFTVGFSGLIGAIWGAQLWGKHHFGPLDYESMMRIVIPSSVAIVVGLQVVFGGFIAGLIGLSVRPKL